LQMLSATMARSQQQSRLIRVSSAPVLSAS
jgi:hypothetical protein